MSPNVKSGVPLVLPTGFDGFIHLRIFNENIVSVPNCASISGNHGAISEGSYSTPVPGF